MSLVCNPLCYVMLCSQDLCTWDVVEICLVLLKTSKSISLRLFIVYDLANVAILSIWKLLF